MISFIYLLIVINVLLVEPSSIRNANNQNEFGLFSKSKKVLAKGNDNGLKIVSKEPFIMKLETQRGIEKFRGGEEKEKKIKPEKRLLKKRYNLKAFRKNRRTKRAADVTVENTRQEIHNMARRKRNQRGLLMNPKKLHKSFRESRNANLTPKPQPRKIDSSKELISAEEKNDKNLHREGLGYKSSLPQSQKKIYRSGLHIPTYKSDNSLRSLIYPHADKSIKSSIKYAVKDLKQDTDRMEKKINFMKRMLRMNESDSAVEISRKSRTTESDNSKAANRIAKMFLALSALNHGKQRSKLKSEESKSWESEEEEQDDNSIKSFNEERYKIKKWIEHMKSKRSSKTCNCNDEESEDHDLFPLERALPKEIEEDSLEECKRKIAETKNPSLRRKLERLENQNCKNCKSNDDLNNKIKALTSRGRRKLELPLEDLEVYRSRAKQILQNAEEILDKLNKEEEEKRYSNPAFLMNRLKDLTSRIHADPRNSENELIKMIQKNMDWSPLFRLRDENEKKDLSKSIKSYFVDPYEKARALTEESARKLSAYLLKNLAMLGNEDKEKEEEESKVAGKKEEMPQIHEAQDSQSKDVVSMSDLNCKKNDQLSREGGLSQPTGDSNQPANPTASHYELDESNIKNSKEIVNLGPAYSKKGEGIIRDEHIQPKKITEDGDKLKSTIASEVENPDDVKVSMDWLSGNVKDVKSEFSKQDNLDLPGEYTKSEANIKNSDKNFSEIPEVPSEMRPSSDPNKKSDLLKEGYFERNTLPKNKEIINGDSTRGDYDHLVDHLVEKLSADELLWEEKTEYEKQATVPQKATKLVEVKKGTNSKDIETIPKNESEGANDVKEEYEKKGKFANAREGIDTLEKKHEIDSKNEEMEIEKNNQDQERVLDGQKVNGKATALDDMSQMKFLQTSEEPLKSIADSSSSEIRMLKNEEPKGENLLGIMENQKQADLEEKTQKIDNLNMSTDLRNQKETEEQEENRESLDNLRMSDELNERTEHTVLAVTDEVTEKVNTENSSEMVSAQEKIEGFSPEKQSDQTSEEKNDKFQESGEAFLKKEQVKDPKDISLRNEKVIAVGNMSPETNKSEELNRNKNNFLASQLLQPKEEQIAKHKNQEQQTLMTKEDTKNVGSDYKEKDASSDKDLKENESQSFEEQQSDKEIVELQKTPAENVKNVEESKINSDFNEKQHFNSPDEENIPPESPISQAASGDQFAEKDKESVKAKPKEEMLGSQKKGTDRMGPREELLGSQERGREQTGTGEELLGSQERGREHTGPREELLGSQESGRDHTKGSTELLDSQEGGADTSGPREELLGSQERGREQTGTGEELLGSQERGREHTGPREELLGSQESGRDHTKGSTELLDSQEGGTDTTGPRDELLGSQERGREQTGTGEELLGSQERGRDHTGPREELLGSQESGRDHTKGSTELLDSQEGGTDTTGPRDELLGSQERGRDHTGPREELLGSQESGRDHTKGSRELLDSQEEGTDTSGPREFLGSQERGTAHTGPEEELLGSQEGGTDSTGQREEFLGSHGRADSTEKKEESLDSQEGGTDSTGQREELLGSQEGGTESREHKKNIFGNTGSGGFKNTENVQGEKDRLTKNWLQSVESEDNENSETTQEGKDWLIKGAHPEAEGAVQSENQKKYTNNSEKIERMEKESKRDDLPFGKKFEAEIPEEDKAVEHTKPQEEFKEKTFENNPAEKAFKENQSKENDDNRSLNEDKRINDEDTIGATKQEGSDVKEEKLLRKIGEEEKEIMMDADNLMNKNAEGGDKEWAAHPFEDKTSNEFKDALDGEDNPLEYYGREESQTSQFLGKNLKNGGSPVENLQKFDFLPDGKNLKIPQEIEKIMKDLNDGKEKEIESLQNLDPAKIDKFIDRIDAVKREEEEESVDCKKECSCADQIELKSRRTGRYEIAKDFLRWLKDMKLNRVLSDD